MVAAPHCPIKYGPPTGDAPPVPAGANGSFHKSLDGLLWLFSRRWVPKGPVKATLMILHGTVDHSGVYEGLATILVEAGIAVFASDMRGWGLSDGEQLYLDNLDNFINDVTVDYHRIHAEDAFRNVPHRFLLGKSIGGLISAYVVARYPDLFTGLIGLSGAYDIPILPPAPVMMLIHGLAWLTPKTPLKPVFDPALIVSDPAALEEWRGDPLVARGKATLGYISNVAWAAGNLPASIPLITKPVFMLWGTGDKVVSLRGHEMMVGLSSGADKRLKQYEGGFHNLLAEPKLKGQVISDIRDWILEQSK